MKKEDGTRFAQMPCLFATKVDRRQLNKLLHLLQYLNHVLQFIPFLSAVNYGMTN